jgi:hypothetical protein
MDDRDATETLTPAFAKRSALKTTTTFSSPSTTGTSKANLANSFRTHG